MSEFEDKLNAILSDRGAMDQIMALARSFSDRKTEESEQPERMPAPGSGSGAGAEQLLSGVDPALLQIGFQLLQEYNRSDERSGALLSALSAYVKPERQASLQRAAKVARLSRVARALVDLRRNRGDDEDV